MRLCRAKYANEPVYQENRGRLMKALATWYLQLDSLNFDAVGSLRASSDSPVGPDITKQPAFADPPYFLGPFTNVKQRYLAIIDHMLDGISNGSGTRNPIHTTETYLLYRWARGLVDECAEMESGLWYLVAGKQKSDRFFFDSDWGITSVLDWEW